MTLYSKERGVIKDFNCGMVGVKFDKFDTNRHALGGRCEMGYGWYINPRELLPITANQNDIRKMTFTRGKFELKGGE